MDWGNLTFIVMPFPTVPLRATCPAASRFTIRLRQTVIAKTDSPHTEPLPHMQAVSDVRPLCRVFDFRTGCVPYHHGWELQHALVDELKRDPMAPDTVVLLEHQPVYTLGTASCMQNVLFDAREVRRDDFASAVVGEAGDAIVVRTERGGEVTYHGPGQLILYPILNLHRHKKDLHWYLRALEDTVIHMLHREYGLRASRKEGLTGVWVDEEKVCAIGLKVSKWITMHGLALNVRTDLSPFSRIVPCGINSHGVSSLHRLVSPDVCIHRARESLLESFDAIFGPYDFVLESKDLT